MCSTANPYLIEYFNTILGLAHPIYREEKGERTMWSFAVLYINQSNRLYESDWQQRQNKTKVENIWFDHNISNAALRWGFFRGTQSPQHDSASTHAYTQFPSEHPELFEGWFQQSAGNLSRDLSPGWLHSLLATPSLARIDVTRDGLIEQLLKSQVEKEWVLFY